MSINLYAPINTTGYGLASLNILKSMIKYTDIKYFPIHNPSVTNQEDYDFVLSVLDNSIDFDPDAPTLKIWHQFDLASRIGRGRYYAYPFFELDTMNTLEKKHLSVPDEIIVSSDWAKNVLENNQVSQKINVCPLGVDRNIFDENLYENTKTNNKYTFLNIGKWEVRKGHDLLPEIFRLAFPNEQDVELIVVASEQTSYSTPDQVEKWKSLYANDARLKIIPGLPSQFDLAQTIKNSDCGIYISRAEGWNLELLETMSMNKPVIATFFSAHTEFCNDNNAYLIDIDEIEKANDGKAFVGQGNWAKIGSKQIDQTIEHMRLLYRNKINSNISGVKTAEKYSWENTAKMISGCILN